MLWETEPDRPYTLEHTPIPNHKLFVIRSTSYVPGVCWKKSFRKEPKIGKTGRKLKGQTKSANKNRWSPSLAMASNSRKTLRLSSPHGTTFFNANIPSFLSRVKFTVGCKPLKPFETLTLSQNYGNDFQFFFCGYEDRIIPHQVPLGDAWTWLETIETCHLAKI